MQPGRARGAVRRVLGEVSLCLSFFVCGCWGEYSVEDRERDGRGVEKLCIC